MGTGSLRERLLSLSALTLPFAGCSVGEAAPGEPPAGGATPAIAPELERRESRVGRWTAVVQSDPDNRANCSNSRDGMKLILLEDRRESHVRSYCSAYGLGNAEILVDRRGEPYLLHQHSDGRGTGATHHYLTVYKYSARSLDERGRFLIGHAVGTNAGANLDYRSDAPPGGGVEIDGEWRIEGEVYQPHPALSRRRTRLQIDVEEPGSTIG